MARAIGLAARSTETAVLARLLAGQRQTRPRAEDGWPLVERVTKRVISLPFSLPLLSLDVS